MTLRLLLLCLLPSALLADEVKRWPMKYRAPQAKVIAIEAPKGVAFAYETPHFFLHSDDEINSAALTKFATVIESVPTLIKNLPLPLWAPPEGGKRPIILCRDLEAYTKSGGSGGSSGYYSGRHRHVLIRADIFLEPPIGRPTRLTPKPNEDLLVHELTHLCMHDLLWRTDPWFTEGFAEYMSAAHIGGGAYDFSNMTRSIRDHFRRNLRPDVKHRILLHSVHTTTTTSHHQWQQNNRDAERHLVYRQYGAALLIIHDYLRDAKRWKEIDTYLKTIRTHTDRRRRPAPFKIVSTKEVDKRLVEFWHPKGLPLKFP